MAKSPLFGGRPPEPEPEPQPTPVRDSVADWRLDQLLASGLDLDRAQAAVSIRRFDVADFRRLVKQGCNPVVAYDICR